MKDLSTHLCWIWISHSTVNLITCDSFKASNFGGKYVVIGGKIYTFFLSTCATQLMDNQYLA